MAVSQEDILNRIQQVYTEMGNTPKANAQIVRDANQFGVTPEQIAQAANISPSQVRTLAEESGQSFTPPTAMDALNALKSGDQTRAQGLLNLSVGLPANTATAGGMLGGTNIDLTQPTSSSVSITQPTESPTLDLSSQYEDPFEQAVFDIYRNTTGDLLPVEGVQQFGGMFKEDVQSGMSPEDAASKYVNLAMQSPAYEQKVFTEFNEALSKGIEEKDPYSLALLLRTFEDQGVRVNPQEFEPYFGEGEEGYIRSSVVAAINEGLKRADQLEAEGKINEANALRTEIYSSDPYEFTSQNQDLIGGDAGKYYRDRFLTEDIWFGGSSPKGGYFNQAVNWAVDDILGLDDSGGLIGSVERMIEDGNPIETLDRWKDKGPAYAAAATAGFILSGGNPAGASAALSLLGANNTLDSGESLSTAQVIGLALNAVNILDLGNAMYTAAGGGELGSGFLTEQSIMNATQNFGLENIDFASLSSGAQAVSDAGEVVQQVNNIVTEPVTAIAEGIINRLGGADALIESAGITSQGEFVEGVSKGVASAAIAEATNKNPTMAFLSEVKGLEQFLPSLPGSSKFKEYYQTASEAVASFEDYLRNQGLDPGAISEQIAMVEDWTKENVYDPEELMATISQIEDTVKDNIDLSAVEDTVRIAGDAIADVTTPVKDAIVETGDAIADAGDAVSDAVSGFDLPDVSLPGVVSMGELAGSGFTPQRGYQPGLAVDTEFDMPERSAVLDILNQPSSVRRA